MLTCFGVIANLRVPAAGQVLPCSIPGEGGDPGYPGVPGRPGTSFNAPLSALRKPDALVLLLHFFFLCHCASTFFLW